MATTSKRFALLRLVALFGLCSIGCSQPAPLQPAAPDTRPPSVVATASPLALESPRFVLEESSIERLSTSGQTAWRVELPKEAQRQMVVLGQTVLLWGGDDELRRLDINTGRPGSPNSPSRTVLAYLTHEQVLVQATATGLIGLGPHKTVWRRDELLVGSLALAGPKDAPVVLAVERKSGQALAIDLNSGANLDFPVPRGKFDKVLLEADSGVIGWVPHEGATIYTNPETGEPV